MNRDNRDDMSGDDWFTMLMCALLILVLWAGLIWVILRMAVAVLG